MHAGLQNLVEVSEDCVSARDERENEEKKRASGRAMQVGRARKAAR